MEEGARRERGVRGLHWRCSYFGLCINMYMCVCLEEKDSVYVVCEQISVGLFVCVLKCRVREGDKGQRVKVIMLYGKEKKSVA